MTGSGQVHPGRCLLVGFGCSYLDDYAAVSPTNHLDPASAWVNETNVYDGDLDTDTTTSIGVGRWGQYLSVGLVDVFWSTGFRFYAPFIIGGVDQISIDYKVGVDWTEFYDELAADNVWVEVLHGSPILISAYRFRLYNHGGIEASGYMSEVEILARLPLDIRLHNGFDNTGKRLDHQGLFSNGSFYKDYPAGKFFSRGLYVDFANATGQCFVQYQILG